VRTISIFALTLAVLLAPGTTLAQSQDNLGDEFIMTFLKNFQGAATVALHLTSPEPTNVTVEYPFNSPTFTTTVSVGPGGITIVDLPAEAADAWLDQTVQNNAVHAYTASGEEFVCYMLNLASASSDAAVALPIDTMNTEYVVITWHPSYAAWFPAEFAVVAAYDGTTVTIAVPGESPFDIVLDRGEGYLYEALSDLTGTIINSDRPIGMTNGNQCANFGNGSCDHVFEAAPAVQSWGTMIPVVNIPENSVGVRYKIVAAMDDTEVALDGNPLVTLSRGESVLTGLLTGSHVFDANKAVAVMQCMDNRNPFGVPVGDPAFGNMVPAAQYMSEYTFSTVGGDQFVEHYLTIIVEDADIETVVLDGELIGEYHFSAIAASGFSAAHVLLTEGTHTTASEGVHGITVEGFDYHDSYIYPGGAMFRFINPVGDENSPICSCEFADGPPPTGTCTAWDDRPSEDINDNGFLDPGEDLNGNDIIDEDTGIFIVELEDDAVNLVLTVTPFIPGDPEAFYAVDLFDPNLNGSGTIRITDGAGNICTTFVDWNFNEPPVCDAGGPYEVQCQGSTTAIQLDASASYDPDPDDVLSYSWSSDCPGAEFDDSNIVNPILTIDSGCSANCEVFQEVTDSHTQSDSCSATVTLTDTAPPAIDPPAADLTVESDGGGNQVELDAWLAARGGASADDVCTGISWSDDYSPDDFVPGCGASGSVEVTFTAADDCGLSSSTAAIFTIVDTTPPAIDTEASNLDVECDGAGNQAELDAWLADHGGAHASDVGGEVAWTDNYDPSGFVPGCGASGFVDVTFTATDECGGFSTTAARFTIEDTTAPAIDPAASDLTVEHDGFGNQAELAAWLASHGGAAASDLCGQVAWSNDYSPDNFVPGCGGSGFVEVTFTATDDCGRAAATAAVFTIVDSTPPAIPIEAADLTVECDGSGNEVDLGDWLGDHGGAVALDYSGEVVWSDDFVALSDECGQTGSATVTFTATDACELFSTTTATFTIVDTTPPTIDPQAADLTVMSDGDGNEADLLAWLDSHGGAVASDLCSPVVWTDDFSELTYGSGGSVWATVMFTATDECGWTADTTATFTITPSPSVDTAALGSLLIYTKVEMQWDADGNLIQDTFLELSNDHDEYVLVQVYFVHGDAPLEADPESGERAHPGWNRVGDQFLLTANQPMYWSASTGHPLGLSPFTILDDDLPPGRPDPEGLPGARMLRGYIIAFAVNYQGEEICWNHLSGNGLIVNYPDSAAWEYDVYPFRVHNVEDGQQSGTPGELHLDGTEYDSCFDKALFDFFAVDSTPFQNDTVVPEIVVDTDLTLLPMSIDLRQDTEGPVATKAVFTIWNMNESKFSGTSRCIKCWDEILLRSHLFPNHFLIENMHTDKGRARIDGLASPVCDGSSDTPLIGVTGKFLTFDGSDVAAGGTNLMGMGTEGTSIRYDIYEAPPTSALLTGGEGTDPVRGSSTATHETTDRSEAVGFGSHGRP